MKKFVKFAVAFFMFFALGFTIYTIKKYYHQKGTQYVEAASQVEVTPVVAPPSKPVEMQEKTSKKKPVKTKTKKMQIVFEASIAGFIFGEVEMEVNWNNLDYDITTTMRPAGVAKLFGDRRFIYKTVGKYLESEPKIKSFATDFIIQEDKQIRRAYHFDEAGKFKSAELTKNDAALDKKIFRKTIDWQSAILRGGKQVKDKNSCNFKMDIVNNVSSFRVTSRDDGGYIFDWQNISAEKIQATACRIKVSNLAGRKFESFLYEHEKVSAEKEPENERERGELISLAYADFGLNFFVPVYVEVYETGFGIAKIMAKKIVIE